MRIVVVIDASEDRYSQEYWRLHLNDRATMENWIQRIRAGPARFVLLASAIAFLLIGAQTRQKIANSTASPTFYGDVLPILQDHCQKCHRTGEIAPMPLVTYQETYRYAAAIQKKVRTKEMPPWFADSQVGHFA